MVSTWELVTYYRAIKEEFPEWEILPGQWGTWSAWWKSPDGRRRRYIVVQSAPELLDRLRTIAAGGRTLPGRDLEHVVVDDVDPGATLSSG
jgi:hypothetical protein